MATNRKTLRAMHREMTDMMRKIEEEENRISGVMSEVMLKDESVMNLIDDYSDADLKKFMKYLLRHADSACKEVKASKDSALRDAGISFNTKLPNDAAQQNNQGYQNPYQHNGYNG